VKVIQAKFRVSDPGTFLRLQIVNELAGFWLSTSHINQVSDTYMDTFGRRLLTAGYSFRQREQTDGLMMTLATLSKPTGAVHHWEKCEILLASNRRPAKWPESHIRTRMLQMTGKEDMVPLVGLQQTRIIRSLYLNEHQIAVVSLDSVGQKNGAIPQVRFEMEVELTPPAREATLISIVKYLENEWDLWPERETKFERAYTVATEVPVYELNEMVFRSAGSLPRIP